MTLATKADVLAAVETLKTSYSYERDPWLGAYVALREVEREFDAQLKPYDWMGNVYLLAVLGSGIALLAWGATRIAADPIIPNVWLDSALGATLIYIPAGIIWLGGRLRLRLASRRHPMLLLKSEIENSLDRFRKLAGDPSPEEYA